MLEDLAWHEGKWASLLGRFRKGEEQRETHLLLGSLPRGRKIT